jgi:hypothetical protein
MSRTVKIRRYSDNIQEFVAHGTITPGMVVEVRSDGKVQPHSGQDENVIPIIALEDELQGKTIADNYAATDPVQCWIPARGDEAYAILKHGQNVARGAWLTSNGDGKLKAAPVLASTGDVQPLQIIGQAVAAANATSADVRIYVRFV